MVNSNDEKSKDSLLLGYILSVSWHIEVRKHLMNITSQQIFEHLLCTDMILDSEDKPVNKTDRYIPWIPGADALWGKAINHVLKKIR